MKAMETSREDRKAAVAVIPVSPGLVKDAEKKVELLSRREPLAAPAKVLIVDDNRAGRMMFQRVAEKLWPECSVTAAINAEEALEAFEGHNSDWALNLIALDIVMPGTDGIELARILIGKGMPSQNIILLSASDYELQRLDDAGLGDVLRMLKPVRVDKLAALTGAESSAAS